MIKERVISVVLFFFSRLEGGPMDPVPHPDSYESVKGDAGVKRRFMV
mgnify:CR=1 FL=1